MKKIISIIFVILLSNCSFDNKTGIWNNNDNTTVKKNNKFKDFETLNVNQKLFNSIILPSESLTIKIDPAKTIFKWVDEFYQGSNNFDNFAYKNLNKLSLKTKKLSRHTTSDKILYEDGNIIFADQKGNIIVYSIKNKVVIFKYNFYKKNFKKLDKKLNLIIEKNIIYIADNIGYLYAINYKNKKLLWAKNYKIPFRSNLKILKNKLILSNQNNLLIFIDKLNGSRLKIIPTEEVVLKNEFINSLAINKNSLYFLNTYGSLYSVNINNSQLDWFVNLNQGLDLNISNLFYSKPLVVSKDKLIIPTLTHLHILNITNGSRLVKIPINIATKPIVSSNYLFTISSDNLLICLNINDGKIIYSINLDDQIAKFIKSKKKKISVKSLFLVNNNLYLFLNNSYLVKMNINGKIIGIDKLPIDLKSNPIFINGSILYLNKSNKLIVIN